MISTVIYILIGAFVGWNLPQPAWASKTQEQILNFFRGNNDKL